MSAWGSAEPNIGVTMESTSRRVDDWWRHYFEPLLGRGGKRVYRTFSPVVVRWIDDRNEAAALGVTVEELLTSRRVAAALTADEPAAAVSFGFRGALLWVL